MRQAILHCIRCGHRVTSRRIEGLDRAVCPACEHVHYENPLPVASAVVLDEQNRLLCVRRGQEPQKGEWCLPIGFAELGETIEEACLRELKEEAGIEGKIDHLLDVSSQTSDFYGDLLTVTFLVIPLSTEAKAGDDATEAAWFDLKNHPPLAFASNDAALDKLTESSNHLKG